MLSAANELGYFRNFFSSILQRPFPMLTRFLGVEVDFFRVRQLENEEGGLCNSVSVTVISRI
jgi:hypothetical protein